MSTHYLLVATGDPYTHLGTRRCYELASRLAGEGHRVTLFLVQNGVLPARRSAGGDEVSRLTRDRIRVVAGEHDLPPRSERPAVDPSGGRHFVDPSTATASTVPSFETMLVRAVGATLGALRVSITTGARTFRRA